MMRWVVLILMIGFGSAIAAPKADIHLHYKWNQTETTSIEDAIAALDAQDIQLAGVIGTPPELAMALQERAPNRIFTWYGVYRQPGDWSRWAWRGSLVNEAERALEQGYLGIGELHLIGGFVPKWDTTVIAGLLKLSAKKQAPLLVHVEFANARYLEGLCQYEPDARLLLAHAGAPMKASEVRKALNACPNLWWELSARDSLRYVDSPIIDEDGNLFPQWRSLILDFSDRLMLGSDPVWPVEQLNPWDEPDSGWDHIGVFWDFHEGWLGQLPDDVAANIRLHNAQRFFKSFLKD